MGCENKQKDKICPPPSSSSFPLNTYLPFRFTFREGTEQHLTAARPNPDQQPPPGNTGDCGERSEGLKGRWSQGSATASVTSLLSPCPAAHPSPILISRQMSSGSHCIISFSLELAPSPPFIAPPGTVSAAIGFIILPCCPNSLRTQFSIDPLLRLLALGRQQAAFPHLPTWNGNGGAAQAPPAAQTSPAPAGISTDTALRH